MRRTLVLGGPGSGKTERLLKIVHGALARGVKPDKIAFVSFTRGAVNEAIRRAVEEFGREPDDFPHFRTVHSLAFRELGLSKGRVLDDDHLDKVSEVTGELLTTLESPFSDAPVAGRSADPLLTLDHYARTTGQSLADAWSNHGSELEWFRLLRFSRAYEAYKADEDVVDFTDMLTLYARSSLPPLDLELAVVDEAQDLSRAQWAVVNHAFARAAELVVGGDDMQQIFHWAGADEDRFLGLEREGFAVEVLPLSHRLPRLPFELAKEVGDRIERRYEREWSSSDREGSVDWVAGPDEVDLANDEWLLLARTRAQLPALAAAARRQGVAYSIKGESSVKWDDVRAIKAHEALRAGRSIEAAEVPFLEKAAGVELFPGGGETRTAKGLGYDASKIWHDALTGISIDAREYYLSIMRRGGKLTDPPRVRVETIHGSKGAEARRVLLSTDMTYRTSRGYELDPDSETRTFYVGLTRCSEGIALIAPSGAYGFRI